MRLCCWPACVNKGGLSDGVDYKHLLPPFLPGFASIRRKEDGIMCMGSPPCPSVMFSKGDNSSDFMFAFLNEEARAIH